MKETAFGKYSTVFDSELRVARLTATPLPGEAAENHRSAVDAGIVDAGDFTRAVGISRSHSPSARRRRFRPLG